MKQKTQSIIITRVESEIAVNYFISLSPTAVKEFSTSRCYSTSLDKDLSRGCLEKIGETACALIVPEKLLAKKTAERTERKATGK